MLLPRFALSLSLCISAVLLAALAPASHAQFPPVSSTTSTPVPGAGHDYLGGIAETVNPATGSVSIRVPVIMPPSRGITVPFAFSYDSAGVNFVGQVNGSALEWFNINSSSTSSSFSQAGWSDSVPLMSDYLLAWTTTNPPVSPGVPPPVPQINCYAMINFVFQDSQGNRHNLGLTNYSFVGGTGPCMVNENNWPPSFDAELDTTGGEGSIAAAIPTAWSESPTVSVTDGDGNSYTFGKVYSTVNTVPTSITDRNGNYLTVSSTYPAFSYVDTTGRTVLQDSGFAVSPETVTVAGLGGPYTLTWTTLSTPSFTTPITTLYGTCIAPPHAPWSTYNDHAVSSITLPNGKSFTLTYDPVYGLLTKMVYPTGGYVRYVWGINAQAEVASLANGNCTMQYGIPVITDRYVSFDGTTEVQHQQFVYSTTWPSGGGQYMSKQTIVKTYDLLRNTSFQTTYQYSSVAADHIPNGSTPTQRNPVESSIAYYNDLGTTLLKTDTKTWQNIRLLNSKQTAFPSGLGAKTTWTYNSSELETEQDDYDFGNPPPGTFLRATVTNYATSTAMSGSHVIDKPASVIVYSDVAKSNRVAETDYVYDSPLGTLTSGIVQHQTGCNCGNLTSRSQWLNVGGSSPTTTFTNDDTGQRLSMTDPNLNTTNYSYTDSYSSGTPPGPTNAFLTTATYPSVNSVAHIEKFAYAYASGEVTSSTDMNNQVTTYKYVDNLARLTETDYPDGGITSLAYNDAAYNPATPSPNVTTTKKVNSTTNLTTVSAMDGLGKLLRSELTSDPGGTTYADTTYDGTARVWKQSNPYRTTSDSTYGITTNYFDALGRPCLVVPPDGILPTGGACPATQPSNTIFTAYSTNTTSVTDQAGKSRKSITDGLGRLTQVFEDPPGLNYETDYAYDILGNLLCVGQKGTNSGSFTNCASIPSTWRPRTFTYDSLSRLLCASNPENSSAACPATATSTYTTGTIGYAYDADGNLSTKTALAPNQTGTATVIASYSYDALNRLTQKSYNDSGFTPTIKYGYDAVALTGCTPAPPTLTDSFPRPQRTSICDGAGAESWSHDVMGRVLTDSRTANSVTKSTVYTYLPYVDGSIYTIAYPSGRTLTYSTGAAERPLSVQDNSTSVYYASSVLYAPQGSPSSITNGPDLYSTRIYNIRLQPCWLYTTTGTALSTSTSCSGTAATGNILDFKFNFNLGTANNGSVAGVTNNRDTTRSQMFSYDSLNRVAVGETTSTHATSPANCWAEAYFFDNLTTAGGAWGNLTTISSPSSAYTGCTGETLSVTGLSNNRLSGFGYDSPGNLNSGSGVSGITYNAENQLVTAAGVTYKYDGDGKRVQKSSGTLYWFGTGSDALDETDLSGNFSNEYVFFGGQRIARRDPSNNVFYYFSDHLGTSRTIAEVASGQSTATLCYDADFYPYGGERSPIVNSCSQKYKFTGKERDSESGLDNFGARHDASSLGRFMSPDPLGGHQEDPQTLNKYVYVRNNPLNITDPTGLDFYLRCTQTKDNGSTCQQQQVGTDSKGNVVNAYVQGTSDKDGNFTATQIGNDANGNLVDKTAGSGFYTGAVDGSGVQFAQQGSNTASAGIWVNGSAETKFSQTSGALAGFSFDFNQTSKQQTANGTFFYPGAPRDAYDAILKAGFSASMADDFFNPLHGYIGSYHYRSDGDPGTGKNSGHLIIRGVGPWHPWDTVPTRGDLHFGETNPNVNRIEHFTKDVF